MTVIHVANAPCSWGSLEFEGLEGKPIGYAQMLDELVETGYAGTELGDWGFMPTDPAVLAEELESRHVTMLGAFVPVALKDERAHEAGCETAVRVARLLARVATPIHKPFLVLADDNGTIELRTKNAGRVTPEMGLSDEEWETFARGAEAVAAAVKENAGLRTVFHHHCAGYVETPDEIARLLEMTDPDLLGLVLDTGHCAFGAGNPDAPLEAFERFGSRIPYVHFKDCEPRVAARARQEGWDYFESVRNGVFCELGKGSVYFPAVLEWLKEHGYEGWICVEQDVLPGLGTPKESARRNREYLKSIGL